MTKFNSYFMRKARKLKKKNETDQYDSPHWPALPKAGRGTASEE